MSFEFSVLSTFVSLVVFIFVIVFVFVIFVVSGELFKSFGEFRASAGSVVAEGTAVVVVVVVRSSSELCCTFELAF